jgi:hypothetical protein
VLINLGSGWDLGLALLEKVTNAGREAARELGTLELVLFLILLRCLIDGSRVSGRCFSLLDWLRNLLSMLSFNRSLLGFGSLLDGRSLKVRVNCERNKELE